MSRIDEANKNALSNVEGRVDFTCSKCDNRQMKIEAAKPNVDAGSDISVLRAESRDHKMINTSCRLAYRTASA